MQDHEYAPHATQPHCRTCGTSPLEHPFPKELPMCTHPSVRHGRPAVLFEADTHEPVRFCSDCKEAVVGLLPSEVK